MELGAVIIDASQLHLKACIWTQFIMTRTGEIFMKDSNRATRLVL